MTVYYRFKEELNSFLHAPDRSTGNELIAKELDMTNDFIMQLTNIIEAPTRTERDAIITSIMFIKHERFAKELADIMEEYEREVGDARAKSLRDGLEEYLATLHGIINAPTREAGDEIILKALADSDEPEF